MWGTRAVGGALALALLFAGPASAQEADHPEGAPDAAPEVVPDGAEEPTSPPPQDERLARAEADYHGAATAEAAAHRRWLEARERAGELALELVELESRLATAEGDLEGARAEVTRADDAAKAARSALADARRQLRHQRGLLQDQAVAAYIGGGVVRGPDALDALRALPGSVEVATTRVYAEAVVSDRKRVVEEVVRLESREQELVEEASATRRAAREARRERDAHVATLESARDEVAAAQVAATEASVEAELLASAMQVERDELALRYATMAASSDSISILLEGQQRSQEPIERVFGMFLNPVDGSRVVSTYGSRLHPILDVWRLHAGVDLDGPEGAAVRSSAPGEVVLVGEQGGYGLTVVVDHGGQLATLYSHLSVIDVQVGDVVAEGDNLGAVGSTGLSTGPHLHWEVRVLGLPIDAAPLLRTS